MSEDQIEHMVQRFLSWKLPEHFNPDAGISFTPEYGQGTPCPGRHQPNGTNLFSAAQAKDMILHLVTDLPGTGGAR